MEIKNNMFSTNNSKSPITNLDFLKCAYSKKIYFTVLIILFYSLSIHPSSTNDHRMNNLYDFLLPNNTSEWLVCGTTSWQDLKNYLPEAKMAGVSVKIMLLPPFQSIQICTEGTYSEPYGNDYILWAQEIAILSLRYSNLTEFGIYELSENLNLGFLRQTYIDSLIAAANSINQRLQFITSNKNYYVDKDATGTGDGTSWTNAANTISSLPWASIIGGDTVYVSGGSTTTVYPRDAIINKSFASEVVITPSWETGHNGDVWFIDDETDYVFKIDNSDFIKITGMNFTTSLDIGTNGNYIVTTSGYNTDVTIDNCHIISPGNAIGLGGGRDTRLTVSNCTIETLENNSELGQDPIVYGMGTQYNITGNTIIHRQIGGADGSGNHGDLIQMAQTGDIGYGESVISNNLILAIVPDTSNDLSAGIYISDQNNQGWTIYNNIIVHDGGDANNGLDLITAVRTNNASSHLSIRIFNNTFVTGNNATSIFTSVRMIDTLLIKNNIFVVLGGGGYMLTASQGVFTSLDFVEIDYNQYYYMDGTVKFFTGASITWSAWQAMGFDIHSDTDSVSFVSIWDNSINAYKLLEGSAGIDDGVDLSDYFKIDINGILRPFGNGWDKGALEFHD